MQEFPTDIIWSFALPQLHLGGGRWQEGKAFLMVENLRWIREEGAKKLYQGWVVKPCHAKCRGGEEGVAAAGQRVF